jgi:amino-acid N-acetyltransferase
MAVRGERHTAILAAANTDSKEARVEVTIRTADEKDFSAACGLLGAAGLPTSGLDAEGAHLWVAVRDHEVIGSAAIEQYAEDGVLRSVCVAPAGRGEGLGAALVTRCIAEARGRGVRRLYLLTETAADWFPRFGFVVADRACVPEAIAESIEFAALCPASAVAMQLSLGAPSGAPTEMP